MRNGEIKLKQVFAFKFDENLSSSSGSIYLEKVKQNYSPNYDYFKITFIDGYLYIKNKSGVILEKYALNGVISLVALKKDYLNLSLSNNKQVKEFKNIKNKHLQNKFNLYVINEDIEKSITKNGILEEVLLNKMLLSLLLGNEENLLQIS
uniref:Neurotoxin accessory protein n=1 Tax=Clostridium botulinum TaxID=1491 RepID=R4NE31_CLOBO|nr:neurotoxin accessory protein [Clostridium botulinum]AGL45053.1 neurotoxin accessory protein [Clostridium botulinum]AGL45093.1 neurotoxin accessory protein [Clostridium botulinum]AGL45133.1 neurotoxin accessory protein [Clostridium botulinum]AGL45173.1 neurotoxin accessory protein [Clostridium botulinum]